MGGESYYVQITTDGEKQVDHADGGQEIISYRYELPGFNKEGKENNGLQWFSRATIKKRCIFESDLE